jgi:excisionase family DNA binding protein
MNENSHAFLMTASEAAKALAIGERTLWGLTKTGQIPCVRINGWTLRYDPADLKTWINKQKGKPIPPTRNQSRKALSHSANV